MNHFEWYHFGVYNPCLNTFYCTVCFGLAQMMCRSVLSCTKHEDGFLDDQFFSFVAYVCFCFAWFFPWMPTIISWSECFCNILNLCAFDSHTMFCICLPQSVQIYATIFLLSWNSKVLLSHLLVIEHWLQFVPVIFKTGETKDLRLSPEYWTMFILVAREIRNLLFT